MILSYESSSLTYIFILFKSIATNFSTFFPIFKIEKYIIYLYCFVFTV